MYIVHLTGKKRT